MYSCKFQAMRIAVCDRPKRHDRTSTVSRYYFYFLQRGRCQLQHPNPDNYRRGVFFARAVRTVARAVSPSGVLVDTAGVSILALSCILIVYTHRIPRDRLERLALIEEFSSLPVCT